MNKKDLKKNIILKNDIKDLKVCLCTVGNKENKYIKDFVQFYENIGVDKIFLYDNNDKDGETFDEVISDYIKKEFVEVSDWRGKKMELINMMDDCYQRNYQKYDWLIFYNIDEYIHLKDYKNIKNFLIEQKFNSCLKIYLNWFFHTDSNLYHYDNRSVQERFPQTEAKPENKNGKHNFIKSMIRGNIPNLKIDCVHRLVKGIGGCNAYGKEVELSSFRMEEQDFENYYIDHYFCKSVDEFIEKLNRNQGILGHSNKQLFETFENYFVYNNMSIEKIEYFENKTGLNLKEYKKKLNKQKKY